MRQITDQLEPQQIETALKPWIIERSAEAAQTGRVWTEQDHQALLDAFRKVDQLATAAVMAAVRRER